MSNSGSESWIIYPNKLPLGEGVLLMPQRDCLDYLNIVFQFFTAIGTVGAVIIALFPHSKKLKIWMFKDGLVRMFPDGKEEHIGDYKIRIVNNCLQTIKVCDIGFKGPRGHNFTIQEFFNMEPFSLNPTEDKSIIISGDTVRNNRYKLYEILYLNDSLGNEYYINAGISVWTRIKRRLFWILGR